MKVIKWISYDEASKHEHSIGGMGGWFKEGHRWNDLAEGLDDKHKAYYEALRASIIENKIKGGGDWHQDDAEGVPLFEDNTVGTFSYRAWGDLLAAVWSTEENRDSHYMEFYISR